MNDFGISLAGKQAIFKKKQFYKANATRPSRTFVCESGPGCEPVGGSRKIIGHWASDNVRDTISSYDLESYLDESGNEIARPDISIIPEEDVKATLILPKPATVTPEKIVAEVVTGVVEHAKATKPKVAKVSNVHLQQAAAEKSIAAAAAAGTPVIQIHDTITVDTGKKEWNPARAVALHKQGMKIVDIAVEMGYERGSGCNRTKAALQKAGVL